MNVTNENGESILQKKLLYDILAAQKCSFLVQLTYFATIFVPGDGFLRQSGTNPIFGAVVGSSLLAFPTAPWSTQPAAVRGGLHLKLPGNQFWEVPTLFFFLSRIEKKSCNGSFFCHLGWAACMQWYAVNCAVEEKKGGDCETNKLEAKPQNQPGSFNPRIPPIRLQEMIKNCQKRNPIKNSNWKFQH